MYIVRRAIKPSTYYIGHNMTLQDIITQMEHDMNIDDNYDADNDIIEAMQDIDTAIEYNEDRA